MKNLNERFPLPTGFKLDKNGRYLGKSMAHWRREADKLVMDGLVRASMVSGGIVGTMATNRLLEIAAAENPETLLQTQQERDRCILNLGLFLASFGETPKRKAKAKAPPGRCPACPPRSAKGQRR